MGLKEKYHRQKCKHFSRHRFKRSHALLCDEEYDNYCDIVISKNNISPKSTLNDTLHESIHCMIYKYISARDMIHMKLSCRLHNKFITHRDILEKMVQETSFVATLCNCVYYNKASYIQILSERFSYEFRNTHKHSVIKALIYWVMACDNIDVVCALIDVIELPRNGTLDNDCFYIKHCVCKNKYCFNYYMHYTSTTHHMSQRLLLQIACYANNISIMKHIINRFYIHFSYIDVWTSMVNNNMAAFQYITITRNVKISQRLLLRYMKTNLSFSEKLNFLQFIFENKLSFFGKRLIYNIINTRTSYGCHNEALVFVKIMEKFGSNILINKTFTQYLYHNNGLILGHMIDISNKIVYKQKHLRMIENKYILKLEELENGYIILNNLDKIEYMVVNKMRLQDRSNNNIDVQ